MCQQIIEGSTNYMKMFALLAQASAEHAKEQPFNPGFRKCQHAGHPFLVPDFPVLEAHIFSLLGID